MLPPGSSSSATDGPCLRRFFKAAHEPPPGGTVRIHSDGTISATEIRASDLRVQTAHANAFCGHRGGVDECPPSRGAPPSSCRSTKGGIRAPGTLLIPLAARTVQGIYGNRFCREIAFLMLLARFVHLQIEEKHGDQGRKVKKPAISDSIEGKDLPCDVSPAVRHPAKRSPTTGQSSSTIH
jgi:hypothetical protein